MSSISSVSELDALDGLAAAKRTIRGLLEHRSATHAVLLFGEEGSGKSTLARFLAGYWLCTSPTAEGPCGACKACHAQANGRSGDLLEVVPTGPSNIIKLGAIKETEPPHEPLVIPIQVFLRTMPILGRHKVVWIKDAERMNGDAANGFLKTLEEPPEYARFVLTTKEVSRVLPTIRSRCMGIPCELPSLEEWLDSQGTEDQWAAKLARRSPGQKMRILENADVYRDLHQFAGALQSWPAEGALAAAETFRKLVERLQKAEGTNARGAATSALRALGTALAEYPNCAWMIPRITESHRRITGNVHAGLEFDALFASILAENRRVGSRT